MAFLAPTTILAEQHYGTALKRFSDFPMNVACLSRFRSLKEKDASLKEKDASLKEMEQRIHELEKRLDEVQKK